MILFVGNIRKKALSFAKNIALVLVIVSVTLLVFKGFNLNLPAVSAWVNRQVECRNPMQRERSQPTQFDKAVDQFVIKLQDFYYQEQE